MGSSRSNPTAPLKGSKDLLHKALSKVMGSSRRSNPRRPNKDSPPDKHPTRTDPHQGWRLNKDSVRKVHSKHRSKGSDSSPTIRMHKEVDLSKVSHKALRSKDSDNSLTDSPLGNPLRIRMRSRSAHREEDLAHPSPPMAPLMVWIPSQGCPSPTSRV